MESELSYVRDQREKVARGPPGGGSLVKTPPSNVSSPSKRSPPGGGRLVREEPSILDTSRTEIDRESVTERSSILKPVQRPVLQPKEGVESSIIRPVQTNSKVLIPTGSPKMAKLNPISPTLIPVSQDSQEEE